jgi:hypothetical protein
MKYLFSILLTVFLTMNLTAQSPFGIVSSQEQDEASAEQVSIANPWFGAKLSYNLNDDRPLDDNFLFSAKVLYTPVSGDRFAVPIVGTVGLGNDDIFNSDAGLSIGIYPYYFLKTSEQFKLIAHGGVGYKVIEEGVEAGAEAPQQVRLVGGLEAAFYPKGGGLPTTLSVTPAYLYHTSEATPNVGTLEIDGIIPVANGLGLLLSGWIPFKKEIDGSFKLGVIINGQL